MANDQFKDESLESAPIPQNFAAGNTFLGYEIKYMNIIQAVVLGIIPIYVGYGIINKYFYVDQQMLFSLVAVFTVGFAYLGFAGIDNVTPGEYLWNYIMFKKNYRKTFYNPRVKTEYISIFAEQSEANTVLPKEKIMEFYNKFIEKRNKADQMAAHTMEEADYNEGMFFEEDFLVMNKPVEYMTKKEIKEMKKREKKAEKQKKSAKNTKKKTKIRKVW